MQINHISPVRFNGFSDILSYLAESYLNTPEKIIEDVKMESELMRAGISDDDLDISDTFERASYRVEENATQLAKTDDKSLKMSLLEKIKNDLKIMNQNRSNYR